MTIRLRFVPPDDPLVERELDLRFRVLRDPLGLGPDDVRFGFEGASLHLLALDGAAVVGCVLFHPSSPTEGRLYQMAVDEPYRGQGLGARLLEALETRVRDDGIVRIVRHARTPAVRFYERAGFQVSGEPFVEVGIEHRKMTKRLLPGTSRTRHRSGL